MVVVVLGFCCWMFSWQMSSIGVVDVLFGLLLLVSRQGFVNRLVFVMIERISISVVVLWILGIVMFQKCESVLVLLVLVDLQSFLGMFCSVVRYSRMQNLSCFQVMYRVIIGIVSLLLMSYDGFGVRGLRIVLIRLLFENSSIYIFMSEMFVVRYGMQNVIWQVVIQWMLVFSVVVSMRVSIVVNGMLMIRKISVLWKEFSMCGLVSIVMKLLNLMKGWLILVFGVVKKQLWNVMQMVKVSGYVKIVIMNMKYGSVNRLLIGCVLNYWVCSCCLFVMMLFGDEVVDF